MENHQGNRLRQHLVKIKKQTGENFEQLAERMGISQAHLSRIFGISELSAETREKATRAFALPLDFFDRPADAKPDTPIRPVRDAAVEHYRQMFKDMEEKYFNVLQQLLELQDKQEKKE